MIRLEVRANQFEAELTRVQKSLRQLRPFFAGEATLIAYDELRQVFLSQGYGSWPPLSARYASYKRRVRPGKSLLRFNDVYFRAATTRYAQGSDYQVSQRGLRVGVDPLEFRGGYPALHETGSGRLPARPVFSLAAPRVEARISEAFGGYVFRRIRR